MSWELNTRLASVAVTVLLVATIQTPGLWVTLVIGFGFAHYLLSFYYSRRTISALLSTPSMILPLVSLGVGVAALYFLRFPLEIFFGLHHAFNEGYLRPAAGKDQKHRDHIRGASTLLHLACYLCVLRFNPEVGQLPEPFLWLFLLLALGIYLYQVTIKHGGDIPGVLRTSPAELLSLSLVLLSLFTHITFLQFVMFHFVLWTLIPLPALQREGKHRLVEYGLLSVGVITFFIVLITNQLFSYELDLMFYYSQFILWSYIHIAFSFALSNAHPDWLTALFREKAG